MRPDESNTMLSGNAPAAKIGVTTPDKASMRTSVPGLVNNGPKTVAAPVCALASSENMITNTPRRTLFLWDIVRAPILILRDLAFKGMARPAACDASRRLSAVTWRASIGQKPVVYVARAGCFRSQFPDRK